MVRRCINLCSTDVEIRRVSVPDDGPGRAGAGAIEAVLLPEKGFSFFSNIKEIYLVAWFVSSPRIMPDSDSRDFGRRTFLRRAAVTGAVGAAAVGSTVGGATATTAPVPSDRASALLDAHAGPVLSLLEADGVLADRDDLPTATATDRPGLVAGTDGTAMLSMPDRPSELRVTSRVESGLLTVAVRPDDGHAFALLDTGDAVVGYDVDEGRYDFETQASCGCTGIKCGPYPTVGYYEACCYGSSCTYQCVCH